MRASAKATTAALIAALAFTTLPAAPAHAWGEREQNLAAAAAAAAILGLVIHDAQKKRQREPQPQPQPVYRPAPHPVPPPHVHHPRPVAVSQTPAARAFNSYSRHERQAIQRRLARMGYYGQAIDGSFGPGTYRAVLAYAQDAGAAASLGTIAGSYAVFDGLIF